MEGDQIYLSRECLDVWDDVPKDLRSKLDSKSELVILIGYHENNQYKLRIPPRCVAVVARDVTFLETQFTAWRWRD